MAELDNSMIAYLGIRDRHFSNPNHTIPVDDQGGEMQPPVTAAMRCSAVQFHHPISNAHVTAPQRGVGYQPVAKEIQ
ncbi:hypothetical protein CJ179_01005 [Rhodococcus sp. ACS1]|nr:hypothetical protein CJ179_01005 [Rhodococcus sp. ACS1]